MSPRVLQHGRAGAFIHGFARGLAGCGSAFIAVNLTTTFMDGGLNSNLWWIDLRSLPNALRIAVEALAALFLLEMALNWSRPPASHTSWLETRQGLWRLLRIATFVAFGVACSTDACRVIALRSQGTTDGPWFSFSMLAASYFAVLASAGCLEASRHASESPTQPPHRTRVAGLLFACALFGLGLPFGTQLTFGQTDYRGIQRADGHRVAVVFGAGVSSDGVPSLALSDRVQTAASLFGSGLVDELWLSGGPGPGGTHETQAMQSLASALGVPDKCMRIDTKGLSTWDTVQNTASWLDAEESETTELYAVSHGYHLARVELAYQRHGIDTLTVPALETRPLAKRHWFALREVAGYWVYWARRLPQGVAKV